MKSPLQISLFFGGLPIAASLNILLFLVGTNQFERGTFEFLAQQLALRHHDVITVKPILIPEEPRLVKPKLHLVREKTLKNLLPKNVYEPLEKVGQTAPWSASYELDKFDRPYWTAHNVSCQKILNSNLLAQLKKDNLDLVITYAGNPCQLGLAHVLGKPTIYFDQEGLTDETLIAAGVAPNLNFPSSHCFLPQTPVHLVNRVINGICLLKEYLAQANIPVLSSLASQRFAHLDQPISKMFAEDYELKKRFKPFPHANELKAKASAYFVNTDRLLEYNRALPSHVIPVGGLHIDHVKPLFSPWNSSIESAESGLIVVSLGTQADSTKMPLNMVKAIYGALSKLTKYRIYWRVGPNLKLAGVNAKNVPPHINLTAYIPQNDLIAHKSCKLLITNGGMLSIMEAVAHGVPIVGIPLYGVNRHNLEKVVHRSLGQIVEKGALTEKALLAAIGAVLESPKYRTTVKELSREFKARKNTPFTEALHWIEFIGRNQGNPLKAANTDLFTLMNLDVLGLLLFTILAPFYVALRLLIRRSPKKEAPQKPAKAKTPQKDTNNNGDAKPKKAN